MPARRLRFASLPALVPILLLSACTSTQPAGTARPDSAPDLPAPVVPHMAQQLGPDDAGRSLTLAPGRAFSVSLVGVPTAGYLWSVAHAPTCIRERATQPPAAPTTPEQLQGATGGRHWETLVFDALHPGRGELVLEQRRPWETGTPPIATYRLKIEVK